MNQGVLVFIGFPLSFVRVYISIYSSVAIWGLLDIHTNLIMHALRLIQFLSENGRPRVGCIGTYESTYDLARSAIAAGDSLETHAAPHLAPATLPYVALRAELRVLAPLLHPEPARCLVSGTGLTHYGSAATRDSMHKKLAAPTESL